MYPLTAYIARQKKESLYSNALSRLLTAIETTVERDYFENFTAKHSSLMLVSRKNISIGHKIGGNGSVTATRMSPLNILNRIELNCFANSMLRYTVKEITDIFERSAGSMPQ